MNVSSDPLEHQLPQLLTVGQISMLSGFSRMSILREIRNGTFPGAWKFDSHTARWRVPRESVIAFLKGEAPRNTRNTGEDLA